MTTVKRFSPNKILIVGGIKSFSLISGPSLVDELRSEIQVVTWRHSLGFVDISEATALLKEARSFEPDLIIGLGGGVSMDYAKLASGWLKLKDLEVERIFQREVLPVLELSVNTVLIPSIFGSGAEATFHAVVYFDGRKYSQQFNKSTLLSSILVPSLSESSIREQRLSSALDAICQGVETAWSTTASPSSRVLALEGLENVLAGLGDYIDSNATRGRDLYVLGANKIGNAMNTGKTTAPHAFSYFLTSKCFIPHGYAVGLLFLKFWAYAKSLAAQNTLGPETVQILESIDSFSSVFKAKDYLGKIDELVGALLVDGGIGVSLGKILRSAGVGLSDLVNSVDRQRLANSPFSLDQEAQDEIFKFD